MGNIIFGSITILLCSIGYFYSWRFQRENRYKAAIALLMLCGLGLLIFISADFFLHEWDERYHGLVAKNLIQHPLTPTLYDQPILPYAYKNWTSNHIWLHKQPLPLWTMAASMSLFGINEIALRLPSILLTTIGIWLTFYIGTYCFNKKVGYLSAFLFSINGLILELASGRIATDHIDIFFLFFIELSIFLSIKYVQKKKTIYTILVGVSIGAAILTKWLPALIVVPIWLLILWDTHDFSLKKIILQTSILLGTILLVSLPWQLYIFNTFPAEASWETSFNTKHFFETLEGQSNSPFFFVEKIRLNYGELIYLPLLWFLWKTIKNISHKKRIAISIWFWIPFAFFTLAQTKMQGYLLFTAPALFIMTAEFYYFLQKHTKGHQLNWLFKGVLILLIALPIRYSLERIKPFDTQDRHPNWVIDLKKLNHENIKNGILFNYKRPIEAMFYTNLTAYPELPDKVIITDLMAQGYTIIINDDKTIPSDLLNVKGVIYKNLYLGI